jgi:hypothetical protein
LRRIILRLLQSGLPLYSQVRHGPLEYGKDITALLEIEGVIVLRHFQAKCGDIDTRKWRESKDELEQIFLVPLHSLQLPVLPQRIEGVLVTNGHANTYVEPVMTGWFDEQRKTHGRHVSFHAFGWIGGLDRRKSARKRAAGGAARGRYQGRPWRDVERTRMVRSPAEFSSGGPRS